MRFALITGKEIGKETIFIVFPPGDSREISDKFKFLIAGHHDGLSEIHLLDSSRGIIKRKRFNPAPAATAAPSEPQEPEQAPADPGTEGADLPEDGPLLIPNPTPETDSAKTKKSKP